MNPSRRTSPQANGQSETTPRKWMSGPLKQVLRVIRLLIGFAVLIVGLLLMITPGPGIVVILIGLAILATELKWAKRLLDNLKRRAEAIGTALKGRKGQGESKRREGSSIESDG